MTNSNQAHKGALLRQSREAQGISLDVVHEATKIPMDALRAIEEGYNVRILSPFYYKAFMKKYAQYLNIPVESVLDEEEEKKERKPGVLASLPTPPRKAAPEPKPKPLAPPVASESKGTSTWFTRKLQQQILMGVCAVIALFIVTKVLGFIRNAFVHRSKRPVVEKPKEERKAKTTAAPQKKTVRPKVVLPPPEPVPAVTTATPKPAQPQPAPEAPKPAPVAPVKQTILPSEDINLTVRAKRNSWLQVRTDGIVVFQSTLNKGDVENWTAEEKIEISGKNINDLEFELNGKIISSLGKSDRQARRLVVTKDGLSIKN